MAAYFLKVKGRPGHQGVEREGARDQGPSSNDFPKGVGSQTQKKRESKTFWYFRTEFSDVQTIVRIEAI